MKGVKPFKDWKLIELTPRQKTGCWITGLLMVALGVVVMVVYVIWRNANFG